MHIKSAKELIVYKKAFQLSMDIFHLSRKWPVEERYALTDQIRRSSRSVCQNLREAWAKRRYEAHFVNKLTDSDGENGETDMLLDFAMACGYITAEDHRRLTEVAQEVGSMLGSMIMNPEPFLLHKR